MATSSRKYLRSAPPIPAVCPYNGFTPDTRSGQVSATVPIPPCGKTTISGPYYKWKRKPSSRSNEGILTRSHFCRTCNRRWDDDFIVDNKADAILMDNLGVRV